IGSFVGKEVSDELATATRNNPASVLGVPAEFVFLERIYLVSDHAGNRHWPPYDVVSFMKCLLGMEAQRRTHNQHRSERIPTTHFFIFCRHDGNYGDCPSRTLRLSSNYE